MKTKILLVLLAAQLVINNAEGQNDNKKFFVSGKVVDGQQRPVSGALIMIDGQGTSVVTDENGNYKIKVSPKADTLTILTFNSGISSAAINKQTTINFVLGAGTSRGAVNPTSAGSQKVDIGYGSVEQKDLLTNVSKVDGGRYATYTDIYEVLKGQAGVMVNGKSIKIQGASSFQAGTEPLFVVDGMVISSIDGILPSQIDNISILKGASTSIYGSRGANGVILINLIKGKK
jgi:TonB-dependent SusC/RagA subfamily outer membrane receptor